MRDGLFSKAGAWKETLKRYQTVLLVLAAGLVLLMLPTGEREEPSRQAEKSGQEDAFDLEAFEEKLAKTLSQIEGAGQARVVLTLKSGARRILAQDTQRDGDRASASPITVGRGSGSQEVVTLQTLAPQFQGALVVCPGGDDPGVRLRLVAAVSALTGLGSDKISVCKST
ncbi:MAG: stage III sporulation protein AG [Lawsonibacter sp.]|nr:stage III sporulation protein AG [Lawsonibacter sp.]